MLKELQPPIKSRPVVDDVSVVIPTVGRPILESCLRWLADGSHWPGCLIIVDQGQQPAVARWLERLEEAGMNTRYVPSVQRGRSAGINRGLDHVATRFVAITDDDCFVSESWLARLSDHLQGEPDTIITGRVELAGRDEVEFSTVTSRHARRYERPQLRVHPFIGGNVGLAMALVARIGYFDEHPCLQSAEDSDYGYRALRLGIPIVYDPEIVLFHYHWRDAGQRAARYRDYSRSQGGFYGTHLRDRDPLIWLQAGRDLIRGPLRWVRGLVTLNADMAERGRADALGLLPGIVAGIRRKTDEVSSPRGLHEPG
jgi:GT2 family glycosyltransferase